MKSLPYPLTEEYREKWERYARLNPIPRRVVAFLLNRGNTYVSGLAYEMGTKGWSMDIKEVRTWLKQHPNWRLPRSWLPEKQGQEQEMQPA